MRIGRALVFAMACAIIHCAFGAGPPPVRLDWHGDELPRGALARLGTARWREPGACRLVAYAPGGKLLASAGDSGVALWDAVSGRRVALLHPRTSAPSDLPLVERLAFSLDGRYLAVSLRADRGRPHVWDVAKRRWLEPPGGWGTSTAIYGFSADGKSAIVEQGREVWSVPLLGNGAGRRVVAPGGPRPVGERRDLIAALSADGKTLAAFSSPEAGARRVAVRVIDVGTAKERCRIEAPPSHDIALSPDGRRLACWGESINGSVIYDAATGKQLASLSRLERGPGGRPAFSPDGKLLFAHGVLWDATTGKARHRLAAYAACFDFEELSASFSPDGKTLAVGPPSDQAVDLWDVKTGKLVGQLEAHGDRARALAYSPDGGAVATLSGDGSLRLWRARDGRPLGRFDADLEHTDRCQIAWSRSSDDPAMEVAFSPDGKSVACAIGGRVTWRDSQTGRVLRRLSPPRKTAHLAMLRDGRALAVYRPGGDLAFRDLGAGRDLGRAANPEMGITAYTANAVTADGKRFVAEDLSHDGLRLWSVAGGRPRSLEPEGPPQRGRSVVHRVAFSADGALLASASTPDGAVRLWRAADGKQLFFVPQRDPNGEPCYVEALAFSPDGRSLAVAGAGAVRVYEALTGAERYRVPAAARLVCFAPDGRSLATAGVDTAVLTWSALRPGRPPADETALLALWADLVSKDAARAYRAICSLAASPRLAAPFLAKRVPPARPVAAEELRRLIDGLDAEAFAERQRAEAALAALGPRARAALEQASGPGGSLEQRLRAGRLLKRLDGPPSPGQLRVLRAVEALEQARHPAATDILRRMAAGGAGATETEHAVAALRRLRRPPPAGGTPR